MKSTKALIVAAMFLAMACLLAGCDQPPKVGGDRMPEKPSSVTAEVADAEESANRVSVLVEEIRDSLRDDLTAATVDVLRPRLEQKADEALDESRAVQATLAGVAAVSAENDKRLVKIVAEFERLKREKAAETARADRAENSKLLGFRIGLVSVGILGVGVGGFMLLKGMSPFIGGPIVAVSAAAVLVGWFFQTFLWVCFGIVLVAVLVGVFRLLQRLGWFDDTLRRSIQAIEHAGKNAFASVKDVKAAIATATDDAMAAIVKEETRPAGK